MRGLIVVAVFGLLTVGCGGGSLSDEEEAWCAENPELVDAAAGRLGLLDFVDTYYEIEGDGIGPDGVPTLTGRNLEVTEKLQQTQQRGSRRPVR